MPVVRIEHPVADYDAWKQAFDSDPIGREQIGVRRYRILRSTSDDGLAYVMVDLELDTDEQAAASRDALDELSGQRAADRTDRRPGVTHRRNHGDARVLSGRNGLGQTRALRGVDEAAQAVTPRDR